MPRLDAYHQLVKNALAKDGWKITDDPFVIQYGNVRMQADLGAEKIFAAEKDSRKIVVEVKVFDGTGSFISKFHTATGQYGNYKALLQKINPDRQIYLAISNFTYLDYFCGIGIQEILAYHKIKLIIFNPRTEEILQWME